MVRLCVFDCDGTLVDGQAPIVAAMAAAFAAHGHPPPAAAAVRRVVGLSLVEAIARLLPEGDAAAWGALARAYSDAFAESRRIGAVAEPLYPGALACLEALEDGGWVLGLATGKSRRGALATLARHQLVSRFVTVQTADVALGKPSPDMVLRAMDDAGAAPSATVMVGDTTYDMMMACSAGALAVGVTWGYHGIEELTASGAHALVDRFDDVASTVQALCDAPRR
ncbi:MAG: HAD-IA family hydrolase [Rhodospirillales bacterium]|nr:HAD-IA family hydrolase [Rhodospirillales bacterium]